jgi:hypothetical protein
MATKRIYLVTHKIDSPHTQATRLIEAASQAEAIRRVVADSITCAVATPSELIQATKDGIEVEKQKGEGV